MFLTGYIEVTTRNKMNLHSVFTNVSLPYLPYPAYPAYPAYLPYPAYPAYSAYPAYPAYLSYPAYPAYQKGLRQSPLDFWHSPTNTNL